MGRKSTVLGIAFSEAAIWTEPSRAETDLNNYRSKFNGAQKTSVRNWRLNPSTGGVVLHVAFD
ncbi:MAG: hypothetical protein WBO58_17635 [Gammaproteobacteria bacterium]